MNPMITNANKSNILLEKGKKLASLAEKGIDPITNLENAIKCWKEAIKGFEKGSHGYAACLSNEAQARAHLADLNINSQENLKIAITAIMEARKEGLKENTESYAINLMAEGNIRMRLAKMGVNPERNLKKAIKLQELSRQKGFIEKTQNYAKSLMNEGVARLLLAEFGIELIDNLKISIRLFNESRDQGLIEHPIDFANTLLNEGTAKKKLADFGVDPITNLKQAIILFRDARERFPSNSINLAMTLINEGNARATLAKFKVAPLANLAEAINLYEKCRLMPVVNGTVLYFRSLANEAAARVDLAKMAIDSTDNLQRALFNCQKALKGLKKDTTEYATTLLTEGVARTELAKIGINKNNNIESAESDLIQAIEFFSKTNDLPRLIIAYYNLGDLKYFEANYDKAFSYFEEAIKLIEYLRASLRITEYRKDYFETVVSVYRQMVLTCLRLNRVDLAFHFTESLKGRMFLDMIGSKRKVLTGPPELLREYRNNSKMIEQIELKLFREIEINPEIELQLRTLKIKHEELLLRIKEYDPKYYEAVTVNIVSLAELNKILNGNTLVEYFIGEGKIFIFVLSDQLYLKTVEINQTELILRIEELRSAIEKSKDIKEGSIDGILSYFYELLIEPVKDLLGKEIVIVPYGPLHLIPFQALKKGKYLVEDFTVSFANSASSLKYLKSSQSKDVLVIGNPTEDLHFSEIEAIKIAEYFKVTPLLRKRATKKEVVANMENKRIIHIASHGKFDSDNSIFSGVYLNDGLLMAIDFINMNLDADLVVLSGCETASARITTGDEIEGLVRAIQIGGSRFVIASLWSVDDETTLKLFENFYSGTGNFKDKLRIAEIDLIKKRLFCLSLGAFSDLRKLNPFMVI